ncbi:hypothetical protein [Ornithinibacillus halophilus]|uniref:Uncharacterized protein n=1 Tax=Ornithinibacillus halophilus TaxID=930117 RepID=A0A1M5KFR8_9BACI|nr:hypothetical protein [Ornithinibacillus halophilus]SHG51581.1 hypothetical protein SAMN05216225_103811 [Ornithinibacillus halophilus]
MDNLSHEQAIILLNELLNEDVKEIFEEELKNAGEHGDPVFQVTNSEGMKVNVEVEWNQEGDYLVYAIRE